MFILRLISSLISIYSKIYFEILYLFQVEETTKIASLENGINQTKSIFRHGRHAANSRNHISSGFNKEDDRRSPSGSREKSVHISATNTISSHGGDKTFSRLGLEPVQTYQSLSPGHAIDADNGASDAMPQRANNNLPRGKSDAVQGHKDRTQYDYYSDETSKFDVVGPVSRGTKVPSLTQLVINSRDPPSSPTVYQHRLGK